MARLPSLRTGLPSLKQASRPATPLHCTLFLLFALMTTIMTDIERPHYTAISPPSTSTFVSCFTSGSVLHSHEQAHYFDDERSWAHLGINMYHASPPAHALSRTPLTAGSSKRHSANLLRTERQCDCSARKLALGRTYTGRSFLEEEQHHRVFTESKRLTHCAYFQQKPDLWREPSELSLFGQRGF